MSILVNFASHGWVDHHGASKIPQNGQFLSLPKPLKSERIEEKHFRPFGCKCITK